MAEASDIIDSGRIPRTIECEVSDEMVDSLLPGDLVTVSGIVKRAATDESVKQNSMYSLYIDVNSITKVRSVSNAVETDNAEQNKQGEGDAFSICDLQCIQQISREPDLFNQLVNSLCPSIFGHEIVKGHFFLSLCCKKMNRSETSNSWITALSIWWKAAVS